MNKVEQFYNTSAEHEWDRLERHKTEFALTMRAFRDYLPAPPARILDIGGGPGRYTIALAGLGYAVTLFDLSKTELELARQNANEANVTIADFVHGNAKDLGQFTDETFDTVLVMGPLYHLLTIEERIQVIREAMRVLKTGGVLCAAFITRFASIFDLAKKYPMGILEQRQENLDILETGVYVSPPDSPFVDAYFAHPTEVTPLMESCGLDTLDLVAVDGVLALAEEHRDKLDDEQWQAWVEINYTLSKDPSIHGAALHLLYIGQK